MISERRELEQLELRLLLDAMYTHYGFDFRGYSRSSLRRRVWRRVTQEQLQTISGLQELVLHDPAAMERLLADLSINVTSMFRDPTFYAALRTTVVPILKTYPYVRIWNAGCSTGEETYSLAILLREERLADRVRIYATDISEGVLRRAKEGCFPLEKMQSFTRAYILAGGAAAFSDYYKVVGEKVQFDQSLVEPVVFAQHNLVSDSRFNEFHLVVCRNVLIYFGRDLQEQVHGLFYDSLVRFGMLALGDKESIRFTAHANDYAALDPHEKLYRRVA